MTKQHGFAIGATIFGKGQVTSIGQCDYFGHAFLNVGDDFSALKSYHNVLRLTRLGDGGMEIFTLQCGEFFKRLSTSNLSIGHIFIIFKG